MNRIPGLIPGLRCPICGGNVYWEYDTEPELRESKRWEQKCLQCSRDYEKAIFYAIYKTMGGE